MSTSRSPQMIENLIAGNGCVGDKRIDLHHKFTGEVIGTIGAADSILASTAVATARAAADAPRPSQYEFYKILHRCAQLIDQERDSLIQDMIAESGFTRKDCENELNRCLQTVITSAEEAKRLRGEMVPVEGAPGFEDALAFTVRVPVGVVCAITPFNSPLNTVAHKVCPAIAAGNAVVLKPSTLTPLSALHLHRLLLEAGLPPGLLQTVIGDGSTIGETLLSDERIDFYTFTGSTSVGMRVAAKLGLRRGALELGSISATVVCADADLEQAARQVVRASFRKAGQVCTSVQLLYVHSSVMDELAERLTQEVQALHVGDPEDSRTDVGPMISENEAQRAEEWIEEAVSYRAAVVMGGRREGPLLYPTILKNVDPSIRMCNEEVFAPVLSLIEFADLDDVIKRMNGSPYGLQAGIFTNSIHWAMEAARQLRVGGIIINNTSSTRADLMPYGGVKASGYGKEGPAYAMREMTEERIVLVYPQKSAAYKRS